MIPFCTGLLVGLVLGAALVALASDRLLRRSTQRRNMTVTLGADDRLRITTDERAVNEAMVRANRASAPHGLHVVRDEYDRTNQLGGSTW